LSKPAPRVHLPVDMRSVESHSPDELLHNEGDDEEQRENDPDRLHLILFLCSEAAVLRFSIPKYGICQLDV